MTRARARVHVEWAVVVPALALLTYGLVFIQSATQSEGSGLWHKQLVFAVAGAVTTLVVMRIGTRRLLDVSFEIYAALIVVLLVLPMLPGSESLGSARWIPLGFGLKLQPSEFMKLGLVLALARHLRHRGVTNTWVSYLGPFLLLALPWFLVMRQPDLGTSLVLLPVTLAMVTVSGARLRHVVGVALALLALVVVAYEVPGILKPYQRDRLRAFETSIPALMDSARELREVRDRDNSRAVEEEISQLKRGTGYQQFYSVVAIGSGGVTGTGLGRGLQNRSNRLPVRHSDFVFAVIGEETGLAGSVGLVLLSAMLTAAVLGVAHRTREPYGRLVCVGVGALIAGQSFMNLGIATALLPVTGLTLPLVSYGGSSLLATCAGLGCVLDVARRRTSVFFEQ